MKKLSHYDEKGRASMVDISAKAETKRTQPLASQRPHRRPHLRQKAPPLLHIDLFHLGQQRKVHPQLLGHGAERRHVLGEA